MKIIYLTLSLLVGIYFLIVLSIYLFQRSLLYHPTENNYLEEKLLEHNIKKIVIPSEHELTGWYYKKDSKFNFTLKSECLHIIRKNNFSFLDTYSLHI